jgi:hypothetical protein
LEAADGVIWAEIGTAVSERGKAPGVNHGKKEPGGKLIATVKRISKTG